MPATCSPPMPMPLTQRAVTAKGIVLPKFGSKVVCVCVLVAFSFPSHFQVNSDDGGGAQEEEGRGGNGPTNHDEGLDAAVATAVAQDAPDGRGDGVGAVFEAEDQAHHDGGEVELAQNLQRSAGREVLAKWARSIA